MSRPIMYVLPSSTSGFSHFVLFVWRPRRDLARRFVEQLRADPKFPRHMQTKSLMDFYLRHRRTLFWERRMAADAWRCYVRSQSDEADARAA